MSCKLGEEITKCITAIFEVGEVVLSEGFTEPPMTKLIEHMPVVTAPRPLSHTPLLLTGPHKVEIAIQIGSRAILRERLLIAHAQGRHQGAQEKQPLEAAEAEEHQMAALCTEGVWSLNAARLEERGK